MGDTRNAYIIIVRVALKATTCKTLRHMGGQHEYYGITTG
jgi:hypothetical protein